MKPRRGTGGSISIFHLKRMVEQRDAPVIRLNQAGLELGLQISVLSSSMTNRSSVGELQGPVARALDFETQGSGHMIVVSSHRCGR